MPLVSEKTWRGDATTESFVSLLPTPTHPISLAPFALYTQVGTRHFATCTPAATCTHAAAHCRTALHTFLVVVNRWWWWWVSGVASVDFVPGISFRQTASSFHIVYVCSQIQEKNRLPVLPA